ncbi:MAG: hypothetical protein V3T31_10645 [candidate division Zixibacteria bacterium]
MVAKGNKYCHLGRIAAAALVVLAILPVTLLSQQPCDFNPNKPSYDHARSVFHKGDYLCSESEAQAILAQLDISPLLRARAYMLVACNKYESIDSTQLRQSEVEEALLLVYQTNPYYDDEPDVLALEFYILMDRAFERAQNEFVASEQMVEYHKQIKDEIASGKKPWYRKWWAYPLGAGVVATAVAVLTAGEEPATPLDTLAGFPGTP